MNKTHTSITVMFAAALLSQLAKKHLNYDLSPGDAAVVAVALLGAVHWATNFVQTRWPSQVPLPVAGATHTDLSPSSN